MRIIPFIVLALTGCSLAGVRLRAAGDDSFGQGIAAYHDGHFAAAARAFENALAVHPATGAFVDLGLAEWQCGRGGPAILAWERALWVDPFDKQAANDLSFAREVSQLDAPQLNWFETLSSWLPSAAWLWLSGASLWLAAGMILLPSVFRRQKAAWHQTVAACALCVFLISLAANWGVVSRARIGFVVEDNAPLLLTPTADGEVTSSLTAGEPARELRARGNYYLIRTESETGWIERDQFGLVSH
ncbi:MAG: hypothetical protein ACRED1_06420 [Limisphaerales bacterium]